MKHTRRNNYKNYKKYKKTRKQKAGAYLGQGSYGVVFAEPRIPCDNEKVGELPDNEVSKIFLSDALHHAQDEAGLHRRFTNGGWSESEIEKLKKYAIIPSRLCRVKNSPEENGEMWNQMEPYTSREWRTNKHTGEFMGGFNLNTIPTQYPYMIISEQGGNDLYQEFKKVKTPDQFYTAIVRLNDIVKGVKMLLDKDFVHPDLKNQNAIIAGDRYKMIDLADVKDITLCHNYIILSGAFMYFTWPSTNVFFDVLSGCSQNSELSNPEVERKIKTKIERMRRFNDRDLWKFVYELYNDYIGFNEDNYNTLFWTVNDSFNFTERDGFTRQQVQELRLIRKCYLNEKTLGIIDRFTEDIMQTFIRTMKREMPPADGKFQAVTRKMLNYFLELGYNDPENLSRELFVRLELHSVGVLMLNLIEEFSVNFHNEERRTRENILANDEILRNQIMRLHRIATRFYLQSDIVTTNPEQMKYSQKNVERLIDMYGQFVNMVKETIDVPRVSSDEETDEEASEAPSRLSLSDDESK